MAFFKSTLSPDDLIKGCIRNDRRTQELLYKQYCQSMLAICRSYTRQEEDAVEILQDAFLKIFRQIEKFDATRSSLYTWMRTIMIRTAIDFLRKEKNQPASLEWKEVHDPAIDADCLQHLSEREVSFYLQQLPQTTRAVFNLFVTEGYAHREIGALLNISEGTSKWHLSEARRQLQQLLLTMHVLR